MSKENNVKKLVASMKSDNTAKAPKSLFAGAIKKDKTFVIYFRHPDYSSFKNDEKFTVTAKNSKDAMSLAFIKWGKIYGDDDRLFYDNSKIIHKY
jgi:hypothetical protein